MVAMSKTGGKQWKKFLLAAGAVILIIVCVILVNGDGPLEVTYYEMSSPKIVEAFRIVQISDLHKKEFGEDNSELITAIKEQHPDMIAITGDLVVEFDTDYNNCLSFCKKLTEIAPVYFCMGNHEGVLQWNMQIPVMQDLAEQGVIVVNSGFVDHEIKGNKLHIGSCNDSLAFDDFTKNVVKEYMKSDDFKLLLVHVPSLFYDTEDCLADKEIDLALAGHFHGGQIIIPGLGGLYASEYGLFPKYAGGIYDRDGKGILVVSRGLGDAYFTCPFFNKWVVIPRINNNPEIVVIDVLPE